MLHSSYNRHERSKQTQESTMTGNEPTNHEDQDRLRRNSHREQLHHSMLQSRAQQQPAHAGIRLWGMRRSACERATYIPTSLSVNNRLVCCAAVSIIQTGSAALELRRYKSESAARGRCEAVCSKSSPLTLNPKPPLPPRD
jgi:hypothetical protein